jgi:hypothetical protein
LFWIERGCLDKKYVRFDDRNSNETKLRSFDYIIDEKKQSPVLFNPIKCPKGLKTLDLIDLERYPSKCCKSRKNVPKIVSDVQVEKFVTV